MKNDENKVLDTNTTEERKPTLSEILKAEEAELKAKRKAEKAKKKGKIAYDINGNIIPDLDAKHVRGIESKKSWYGFYFILPWLIGLVLFFLIPLISSLTYAFSEVIPESGYMDTTWTGLENFNYIFDTDDTYQKALLTSIGEFFAQMPIIIIVSLILALILNSNFKGRTFFRGVFFVPVIVAAGVVMGLLTQQYGDNGAIIQLSSSVTADAYSAVGTGGGMDFSQLLNSLELPEDITAQLNTMITDIFNTIWSCGIPVVLFIAGLQTIPAQLYEASKVEGATAWEEFWYITLPCIGQTLLLVIVFSLIELLTKADNPVINLAYEQIRNVEYGLSSAMLWLFFAIIGSITGIIILIFSKTCLKRWE